MKIVLIYPRLKYTSGDPPLGIGYIYSALSKKIPNCEINLIDSTFFKSEKEIYSAILRFAPDIAGIYSDSLMFPDAYKIGKFCLDHNITTIVGGPHITVLPQSFAGAADFGIIGEGENKTIALIKSLLNNEKSEIPGVVYYTGTAGQAVSHRSTQYNEISDPQSELMPFRSKDTMQKYIENCMYFDSVSFKLRATTIIATRGCPYSCTYCQPTLRGLFGNRVKYREIDSIITEIAELKKEFGIDALFFHDDTLFFNKEWALQLIERLAGLDMVWGCNTRVDTIYPEIIQRAYESGLRVVHLGIESATDRIVNGVYKKNIDLNSVAAAVDVLEQHNVRTLGFFMLGAPTESMGEVIKTIRFAAGLNLSEATFSITTPFPGTALFEGLGVHKASAEIDYYRGTKMKRKVPYYLLRFLQIAGFIIFYLTKRHKMYIIRHLKSKTGLKRLFQKVKRYI